MAQTTLKLTPADGGRRMSLAEFEHAEATGGKLYELGRGVVTVVDIPNPRHGKQVNAINRQLRAFDLAHPGVIDSIFAGSDCKLLLADLDSERHPDVAVYKTAAPDESDAAWSSWVPELVVEVVSPGSEERDYVEKREEYLRFGVREYWVIDADKGEMLVLRRRGRRWTERVVRPPERYRTTLFPGLEFDIAAVFAAVR